MHKANFAVSSMHGDMPQQERDEIMNSFRTGDRFGFFFYSIPFYFILFDSILE